MTLNDAINTILDTLTENAEELAPDFLMLARLEAGPERDRSFELLKERARIRAAYHAEEAMGALLRLIHEAVFQRNETSP